MAQWLRVLVGCASRGPRLPALCPPLPPAVILWVYVFVCFGVHLYVCSSALVEVRGFGYSVLTVSILFH